MRHPYQILLPLLSLFWVRVDLTDLFPLKIPVEIVDIRDGDTMAVRTGNRVLRVRLSRIDAPELHQKYSAIDRDAGIDARDCVRKLAIKLATLSIEGFDLYHRILGNVDDINFLAVKNGCSGLYPHARFDSVREKMEFLRALLKARELRLGVWKFGGYQTPKVWRKISKRSGHQRWRPRPHSRVTYRPGRKRARREY